MTQVTAPPEARQPVGTETCPCCGQRLLDQEAARHLEQNTQAFERRLEAAVQARVVQLANELAAKLEAEHEETLTRTEHAPDDEEQLAAAKAEYAADTDKLRLFFRQF